MRELLALRVEDGWEVRDGGEIFGRIGDPRASAEVRCVTPRGQWLFTRLRGGDIEATMGTAVVARYESKLIAGGTIVLPDDSRLRLRRPVAGDIWRLRRGRRELVLDVRPMRVGWAMRVTSAEPLIPMFAFHVVLSELARPSGGDTGPAPGYGF